ncbi:hypothetical protein KC357_g106 [Hortaea werneckii]|nr:hypothetical protein KC357_g106 [Hortaea werneckii]
MRLDRPKKESVGLVQDIPSQPLSCCVSPPVSAAGWTPYCRRYDCKDKMARAGTLIAQGSHNFPRSKGSSESRHPAIPTVVSRGNCFEAKFSASNKATPQGLIRRFFNAGNRSSVPPRPSIDYARSILPPQTNAKAKAYGAQTGIDHSLPLPTQPPNSESSHFCAASRFLGRWTLRYQRLIRSLVRDQRRGSLRYLIGHAPLALYSLTV